MYAVKAIYDGVNFKPLQPVLVEGQYEVVITFLEPMAVNVKKRPRSEVFGILEDKVWMSDDFNDPLEEFEEYM